MFRKPTKYTEDSYEYFLASVVDRVVSIQNSYAEALTPNVTAFGDGSLEGN